LAWSPVVLQVEVAFREQTAGHNALLLLVALSHELLEERLRNAFLDVHARAAEVRALSHAFAAQCPAGEGHALVFDGPAADQRSATCAMTSG
jgi:hypothetical protein